MKEIKHIYFDVGGVLLLDFSNTNKWVEMRRDLGVTEDQDEAYAKVKNKFAPRICTDLDIDETIPFYEDALGFNFPDNYSMLVDFVDRFELNESIWPVVKKIKENYKVGLLTNMYPRMLPLINERNLIPDVEWDVVVDSSVVGYQKPDDAIYEIAEKMAGVDGDEILFIDNSVENVESAKRRGWRTVLYDTQEVVKSNEMISDMTLIPK